MKQRGTCREGQWWFLGHEFFWVTPSSTSMVTPSKAQGGLELTACCLQLQIHPGIYTQATSIVLQLCHDYKQTCHFQAFPFLVPISSFTHNTNASSVSLLEDRLLSLPPHQWILKQKEKKNLSQLFSSLILSKGYRSSGPLQSVAGRAITEPPSLFSTGITRRMIILGLIIPCLWLPFSIWELTYLLIRFFPILATADIFQSFS